MHVYDSPAFWLSYYKQQAIQSGHGLDGFHGLAFQRGAGLGSFFKSLFRIAVPVLKRVATTTAKRVGHQALGAVGQIAADISDGRSLKDSIQSRGKQAVSNVLHETANSIQTGNGLGVRPANLRLKLPIKRKQTSKKLSAKKRRRLVKSDIFGGY